MNKFSPSLLALFIACTSAYAARGAPDIEGDAKAGEKKVTLCMGCHGIKGYQSSFPEVYKVPMIAGQGADYIMSALTAYKKGDRKHPTMRGVADTLSEQDIADVAVYFQSLGKVEGASAPGKAADGSAEVTALVSKGACTSCHGDNFSKPLMPNYPKIAGQHADYLFAALKSYKTEDQATWGRAHPIMGGVAKQFTNDELKALAEYVSTLPGEVKTVPQASFK